MCDSSLVTVAPPPILGAIYQGFTSIKWSRDPLPRHASINSGATHNFIDKWTIWSLGMGTHKLSQNWTLTNIDRTENQAGVITDYCNLCIWWGTRAVNMGIYVANLRQDWLIFGVPWFHAFNPSINWSTNLLEGHNVHIEMAGYQHWKRSTMATTVIPPPQSWQIFPYLCTINNIGRSSPKNICIAFPLHETRTTPLF